MIGQIEHFGFGHVDVQSALVRELPALVEALPSSKVLKAFFGDALEGSQVFSEGDWYVPQQDGPWVHRVSFALAPEANKLVSLFFGVFPTHIRIVCHDRSGRQASVQIEQRVVPVPVLYGMSLREQGQELSESDLKTVGIGSLAQLRKLGEDRALNTKMWYRWFEADTL
jgi:hypothetical protein